MAEWYRRTGDSIILTLHIQPGAKQTSVTGLHGDALKVRLAAPPIEGRANEALLKFIADFFRVTLSEVALKQGGPSRHKRVEAGVAQSIQTVCWIDTFKPVGFAIARQSALNLPHSNLTPPSIAFLPAARSSH